jgi:3-hydroxyisobutyrate dehydrogenase-like beta-hydroxyacid dehydrogenase
MVGGEEADFMAAQGVLGTMGKAVIHAGPNGAGQAAKVCNNMLLGASMIATCEAFSLAGRLGLDLQTFYDISSKASGQCWSMTSYCPVPGVGPETPADHGYEGGFATALMLKDLTLAMEAAQGAGAAVPMGGARRSFTPPLRRRAMGVWISRPSSGRCDPHCTRRAVCTDMANNVLSALDTLPSVETVCIR